MASSDVLRKQLSEVESELAGLDDRRTALEQAAADLRSAIDSVTALEQTGVPPSRSAAKPKPKAKPRPKRPTVTPDDLLGALQDLGGTATVEQLVDKLDLPDGRSLNGARRIAVDAGIITYEDRTYTAKSA